MHHVIDFRDAFVDALLWSILPPESDVDVEVKAFNRLLTGTFNNILNS